MEGVTESREPDFTDWKHHCCRMGVEEVQRKAFQLPLASCGRTALLRQDRRERLYVLSGAASSAVTEAKPEAARGAKMEIKVSYNHIGHILHFGMALDTHWAVPATCVHNL